MKKILLTTTILLLSFQQNISSQGWQWVETGFPVIIFDMSFPSGQSDIGFAVGSTLTFGGDGIVLKTTNSGLTWFKISADTLPGLKAVFFTSLNVGYAGGYQNLLMKTTDGGSTWTQLVIDTKLWYFNNIEFWDANNGIVVSYPSTVYRTTDSGMTWSLTFGVKHSVEDICYADANTLYFVGGDEKIYRSTNGGFLWSEIYGGEALKLFLGVEFYNTNFGIVTGEDGKVLVTTNGGTNWAISNAGGYGLMRSIYIFDQSNAYVVGTPEQVYKTTNGGNNWLSDFNGGNSEALYKIKFTENLTGLICGSQGKFLINTDYIVPVELTAFNATAEGNAVLLNWTTKTELNNAGFEILRSFNDDNEEKIAFIPGNGTTAEQRNYTYTDDQLANGSYSYRLKQIDFEGNFEYSNAVNISIFAPIHFKLEQNFPNPFNPSTKIRYEIPSVGISSIKFLKVSLKVYDLLGNEIATLVDEEKAPGYYDVEFNVSELATGVYIYRIEAGEFTQSKKMVLLK